MGGVDRMDGNIDKYRVCIKSKRWWWVLFTFCLDTAVHNAWQKHREYASENTKLDYLHFRRIIVQAYLQLFETNSIVIKLPLFYKINCFSFFDLK